MTDLQLGFAFTLGVIVGIMLWILLTHDWDDSESKDPARKNTEGM